MIKLHCWIYNIRRHSDHDWTRKFEHDWTRNWWLWQNWGQVSFICWWLYLTQTVNSWTFQSKVTYLKYFWVIFNTFWVIATSPKRYHQKFSELNWEKIARRQIWKSESVKCFLCQISYHNTVEFLVCIVFLLLVL